MRTGPVEQSTGYRAISFYVKSANESAHALEARGVTIGEEHRFRDPPGNAPFTPPILTGNYLEFVETA